jgi:hypothetical protein
VRVFFTSCLARLLFASLKHLVGLGFAQPLPTLLFSPLLVLLSLQSRCSFCFFLGFLFRGFLFLAPQRLQSV